MNLYVIAYPVLSELKNFLYKRSLGRKFFLKFKRQMSTMFKHLKSLINLVSYRYFRAHFLLYFVYLQCQIVVQYFSSLMVS